MKNTKLYSFIIIITFMFNIPVNASFFSRARKSGGEGADVSAGVKRVAPETVGRITPKLSLEDVIVPLKPNDVATDLDVAAQDVAAILRRAKKAAPINVAKAGAGKSEFIRYLQFLINEKSELVSNLHGKTLYYLNVNKITGGTELQGSLQQRLDEIVEMISDPEHSNKILVVDELEEILKDEKHGKAFIESMKTYMAGEMGGAKLIFNITPEAYENLMTDPQLIRRMVKVFRNPPSDEAVNKILRVLAEREAAEKGIVLSQQQLDKIFRLSKMNPSLSNPDVAITLLDDAVNRALADLDTGARKITEAKTTIRNLDDQIKGIELNQEQGVLKFFGPFFQQKRARLLDRKERLEGIVKSYDESRQDTSELRKDLLEKMRLKKELQDQKKAMDTDQDPTESSEIQDKLDEVIEDINRLSLEIKDENPLLTGVEVSDEHILESALINLPRSEAQILDEMNGGVGSTVYTNRLIKNNPRFESNADLVKSIVSRILLKRRITKETGDLPAFIIIDNTGENARELVNKVSKELYETDPYPINGSEITHETRLNRHIGASDGYGTGKIGALYKAGQDSHGYMTVLINDFDRGVQDLLLAVENLVEERKIRSNLGDLVDFNDTSVFMTTRDSAFRMSEDDLSEFNSLRTETERQDFLREHVKKNFSGRRSQESPEGFQMSETLLDKVNIIYLDDKIKANLDIEIANRIKGDDFKEALERMEVSVDFDESAISYISHLARQKAGNPNISRIIEEEILSFLHRATENGTLVPGDKATLQAHNSGFLLSKAKWSDPSIRKALIDEQAERLGGKVTDEQPVNKDPRKVLEDLLRENSRLR